MAHIIHKVISNHSMTNLERESNIEYNKSVIALYYMFLKKYGLFNKLYTVQKHLVPKINNPKPWSWTFGISGFSNTFTTPLLMDNMEAYGGRFVISQLWRGFALDNIDKISFKSDEQKKSAVDLIKRDLRWNGDKGDDRVKEILKRHSIKYL